MAEPHQVRPDPDPTTLTTAQLMREIASLKAEFNARLDGIDKATALFEANLTRVPTDTDKQIQHLREFIGETFKIVDERFNGVEKQFTERDVRVLQSAAAATTAVNAALQAAKEAVGEQNKSFTLSIDKSEAATMKQIDALLQTVQTATGALNDKIDDVKSRQTTMEGRGVGKASAETTQSTSSGLMVGIGAVGVALVSAIIAGIALIHAFTPAVAPALK